MGSSNSIPAHPKNKTMKAVAFSSFGDPSKVLALTDLPFPHSFPDTAVVIKVKATSINPVDKLVCQGALKALKKPGHFPQVLSYDAAGTVEVPDAAGTFKKGDEVFVRLFGTGAHGGATQWYDGSMAEYCVALAEHCAPKPAHASWAEAASVPLAGLTALQVLRAGGVGKGSKVFISGGAGGVGTFAIQIAKHVLGASHVVTTASAGAKTALCKKLGADEVVDYKSAKFEEVLEGRDFDMCFDLTGEDLKMAGIVKKGGHIISIVGTPTVEAVLDAGLGTPNCVVRSFLGKEAGRTQFKAAKAAGASWSYMFLSSAKAGAELRELAAAIDAGKVKPVLDSVHSYEDWAKAVQRQFSGRAKGKVVVDWSSAEKDAAAKSPAAVGGGAPDLDGFFGALGGAEARPAAGTGLK